MYGYEFDVSKVTISNKCTIRNKQLLAKNIFRYKSHCELSRDLAADAMVKALLNQPATEYNTSRLLCFMFISVALHFVILYKICCESKTQINQSDDPELHVQVLNSGSHWPR